MQLSCYECALRACGLFKPVTPEELDVINQIKRDHLLVPAGGQIVRAGDEAPELYTLYSGWAFRFKTLPDGRRQILNFLLPGALLGLQAAMFDAVLHGIEALTEVELCVLPRRDIWTLFGDMPALAFDVTWLGSREEYQCRTADRGRTRGGDSSSRFTSAPKLWGSLPKRRLFFL
jgi:CRP-like cAMP-binding protein